MSVLFLVRALAIGAWFVLFSLLTFPLCLVRWGHRDLVRWAAHLFSWGMRGITGIRVEVGGLEHLKHQPCIYVLNHQSGFDMASFGSIYPHGTVTIGKKQILWIPFFGIVFKACGNILIDRNNRQKSIAGLAQALEAMKDRGLSIIIFPEGTRNTTSEPLLPFKKGGFHMAIAAQVPVVPMVCSDIKPLFDVKKGIIRPGVLQVRVLPPIPTQGLTIVQVDELSSRAREEMKKAILGLSTQVL